MNRDFQQLRKVLDGGDSFVSGGHQIVGLRKRKRPIPEWTRNNEEIKKILIRSFPKLATNSKQRARAARWAIIIHLYFKLQYTRRQIAEEINASISSVNSQIRSILRVHAGIRADGTGKFRRK